MPGAARIVGAMPKRKSGRRLMTADGDGVWSLVAASCAGEGPGIMAIPAVAAAARKKPARAIK
jgi:hypothetical protein